MKKIVFVWIPCIGRVGRKQAGASRWMETFDEAETTFPQSSPVLQSWSMGTWARFCACTDQPVTDPVLVLTRVPFYP